MNLFENKTEFDITISCLTILTLKIYKTRYEYFQSRKSDYKININEYNFKPLTIYFKDCIEANDTCYQVLDEANLEKQVYIINYSKVKDNKISFKLNSSELENKSKYIFELLKIDDFEYCKILNNILTISGIEKFEDKRNYFFSIKSSNSKGFVVQNFEIEFKNP